MATVKPIMIVNEVLSRAWVEALALVSQPGVDAVSPLVVSVTGFSPDGRPIEDEPLRQELDSTLGRLDLALCRTVANTIFPRSLWNPARGAEALFERYLRLYPRIARLPANRLGTYFHRMIAFDGGPSANQLAFVMKAFRANIHRRSAYQIAIFDPKRDHRLVRQRGFPCLQQVALTPIGQDALALTGFYATQYIGNKAYGNYLGLSDLGAFMAHELGRRLVRLTCVAANARLGDLPLSEARRLVASFSYREEDESTS